MTQPTSPLPPRLVDTFGRVHNNLRISVTDRCNIRCLYCMPENVTFLPREGLLTFEEIVRFVEIAARLGIDKIRLTGGEPLVRRGLPRLIEMIAKVPGITDIGLTTNGILLGPLAQSLWNAGLRRLNVSLDTMDPVVFQKLTRRSGFEQVIEGILAARAAGFDPLKLNAIAIKGLSETSVAPLGHFAREHGLILRFIEYMPLDAGNLWERDKVLYAADILEILRHDVGPLSRISDQDPRSPSLDYRYDDGMGRVGMIASVSRPFCSSCNRLRITADGKLRNCLFSLEETDLRAMLRNTENQDRAIAQAITASVSDKWEGHEINTSHFIKPERLMHSIGG